MAQRLNKCPQCKCIFYNVLEMYNPNTTDMNAKARLECDECKHVWEDKVTSPHYESLRRRGLIR